VRARARVRVSVMGTARATWLEVPVDDVVPVELLQRE